MKSILSLSEIIDNYDTFIIDQWGVMHDGINGYPKAIECINYLHKKDKNLIIISNSSKRSASSYNRLPKIGFNPNYFKKVITSGEMIWNLINNLDFDKENKKNCFHIFDKSKEDGIKFRDGLNNINFIDNLSDANFILACTPYENTKPIDYIPLLKESLEYNLTMYCANPDFETVEKNNKSKIFCMGMISELYKNMGGRVIIQGKPEIAIYDEATNFLELNKSRTIAIGDSLYHDIKGANNFKIDSILVKSGIHKDLFTKEHKSFENLIRNHQIYPKYLIDEFCI